MECMVIVPVFYSAVVYCESKANRLSQSSVLEICCAAADLVGEASYKIRI